MARYSSSGGAPVTPAPLLATPMCVGPGGAPVPPAPLLATPMRVGPGGAPVPLHHFWLRLCVWALGCTCTPCTTSGYAYACGREKNAHLPPSSSCLSSSAAVGPIMILEPYE